ncbi:14201_t:CDS:2 [Funneliformis caledonium]|uniref:14201_t:CDS:1 n=1 Tax=Funneliformis caledonium TaxID=1117310 RepID=A0A9N9CYG5_9GLOM|nr:14201_t:CDS:2 [Funneliformis caledonium]
MGSTMHVVAFIEQKSRQNGIDYGVGRFRCEAGQFGTFRFKIISSAKMTKYCHSFTEGDVVTLVGQFSYETIDKEEGFTLNVSVATPFPSPSSGCWEPEEIPISAPYLSFHTQPISGSLRQIENCQFVRTKSSIHSGYSRSYTDPRFRVGYQTDNEKWNNMAFNWDAYSQFFISGFFLYVDNGEVHIEATEIEVDPSAKKCGKTSNISNSTVPGVSPLAKNLARLLEQEKISFSTTSTLGTFAKNSFDQTSSKPEKKPASLRPLAPKSASVSLLHHSQNQMGLQSLQSQLSDQPISETLSKDLLKGMQAYHHIMQRLGNPMPSQPPSHMPVFSTLQQVPSSEPTPSSTEQIAELIAEQAPQVSNQIDREKSLSNQNERDKPSKPPSSQQASYPQELVKSPTHYTSPQNERELTPSRDIGNKNDSVRSSRAESESSESIEFEQTKKSGKKSSPEDKSKSSRPTSRNTLGNRFIVYEPKIQESEGIIKPEGTLTGKRGRKSKNSSTARSNKKAKNKKNINEKNEKETTTTTTNQEEQITDIANGSPKNPTDKEPKKVSEKSSKNSSDNSENTILNLKVEGETIEETRES